MSALGLRGLVEQVQTEGGGGEGGVREREKAGQTVIDRLSRSRSSVGRALDSVWWQHTSRFQKSGVRGATGARCLSSILAGMVAVGGRP